MKATRREKLQYKFENFMAQGGKSIFISLMVLFLGGFVMIAILRAITLYFFPEIDPFGSFFEHLWLIFLEMTDPGNMARDTDYSPLLKVSAVLAGLSGVIILSMLIAFITTQLDKMLWNFRRGRSRVLESDQTLILGWNERVMDIIRELIIANESEENPSVVILSERPKEEMDDAIQATFPDSKNTRIITRHGSPARLADLERVSPAEAKSAIILASCSQSAIEEDKQASDANTLKTILALLEAQGGENDINIVVELLLEENRNILSVFNSDKIISLNSWEILGKLVVQTAITSGLSVVYDEMLSFDGCELYIHHDNWKGLNFYDLPYHLKDGVPLGVRHANGTIVIRPEEDFKLAEDDEVIILAEDDSTIILTDEPLAKCKTFEYGTEKLTEEDVNRELILGWHTIVPTIIRESADYLKDGAAINVLVKDPDDQVRLEFEKLQKENPNLKLGLIEADPLSMDDLKKAQPFSYDTVIILSQNEGKFNVERLDSETLVTLLLLRKLAKEQPEDASSTKLITQILNSDNEDLMSQADVDDFIISNKMITQLFAQVSENPDMLKVYQEMFKEEGSEIYLKPARLYFHESEFPVKARFVDIIKAAESREEICLGVRKHENATNSKANFGVKLNPAKDATFELHPEDSLVVLAEDFE